MANEVEIRITANDMSGPAFASAAARASALKKALDDAFRDRVLNLSTAAAMAKIEALKAAADGIKIGRIDMAGLGSDLEALKQKMQSLGIADLADVNMQPGRIMTQLQLLKRLTQQAGLSDLIGFNLKNSDIASQLAKIHGLSEQIPISYKVTGIPVLPGGESQNIADKFTITGLDIAARQLDEMKAQTDLASSALAHMQSEKDALIEDINMGLIPALGHSKDSMVATAAATAVSARGFGFWGGILTGSIGGIAAWHLALDGALEATVSLGAAAAALTVGLAAMAPTALDVYTHLKAVATVNQSLGASIPPLTGKFQALAQAMAPQTIEVYGGALNFLNTGSGALARTAAEVVTGIDDLVAKLDIWKQSQTSTGKVLETGVGFLHQFEGILGSVAAAIQHLVNADPGTAHYLLDVVGAGAKLLDLVTRLPAPIIASALAIHSLYIWGNVAAGALGKLVGLVPGLGKLGDILGHGLHVTDLGNPYGALAAGIIVAGAAFAYLAAQGNMATNQVRGDINATNAALAQMNASQAMGALITDITKYQMASANAFSPQSLANIRDTAGNIQLLGSEGDVSLGHLANALSDFGKHQYDSAFKGLGDSITGLFDKSAAVTHIAENNAAAYSAEIQKLTSSQHNLYAESGKLMAQGFSLAQSFALMDLAGVKVGDSFDLMQQKVKNLITGYQNMSVSGNILANSVNAVTFASLQQQSGVSQLNQGWDTFMQTITGGASSFVTFGQDLGTIGTSAKVAGASMTGLNAQSLTLQGSFLSATSAANSQMDSLTTLASAAGLGTQGTNLLGQANKDLVAALLPAAGQSQTMTDILYALAQRGGYTGADSFKALSQWVGNTANPMTNLQGIVTKLTGAAGNLTTDVQNLSTALGTTLNQAMAQVIFTTSGGIGPMNNLAKAIDQTGLYSKSTAGAALSVAEQFVKMTGSVSSAKGEFETFAMDALGLTRQQADALWQKDLPGLQNYINGMHGKTLPIKADTSQATAATNAVQALINSLHGSTVYVKQVTQFYTQNLGSSTSQGRAMGGIVGNIPHAATGGVRNGLTLVGELGPELVRLPQGSQVYPHGVTPGYASQGSGGNGGTFTFEVASGGSTAFEQFMVTAIREWVRLKGGGNVQKAFGRNN